MTGEDDAAPAPEPGLDRGSAPGDAVSGREASGGDLPGGAVSGDDLLGGDLPGGAVPGVDLPGDAVPGDDAADDAAPDPEPNGEPSDLGTGLGAVDREILALENLQWKYQGAKEMEIRRRLHLSPTHYYQRLNVLIDTRAALEHAPMLVARLRRQRGDRE